MYAVVLGHARRPEAHGIHQAHAYVLDRLASTLRPHAPLVERAGTSDLVMLVQSSINTAVRKFSGNSLRMKRTHFLYHGTLLYNFDLALIGVCLRTPPRQPEYRRFRAHADFVANLPLDRSILENAVSAAWPTDGEMMSWPRAKVDALVRDRYSRDDWNLSYGRPAKPR
jgi:lipoate-protein ligase A